MPPIAHQHTASGRNPATCRSSTRALWRSSRTRSRSERIGEVVVVPVPAQVAVDVGVLRRTLDAGLAVVASSGRARRGRARARCRTTAAPHSSYPPRWCGGYMLPTVRMRTSAAPLRRGLLLRGLLRQTKTCGAKAPFRRTRLVTFRQRGWPFLRPSSRGPSGAAGHGPRAACRAAGRARPSFRLPALVEEPKVVLRVAASARCAAGASRNVRTGPPRRRSSRRCGGTGAASPRAFLFGIRWGACAGSAVHGSPWPRSASGHRQPGVRRECRPVCGETSSRRPDRHRGNGGTGRVEDPRGRDERADVVGTAIAGEHRRSAGSPGKRSTGSPRRDPADRHRICPDARRARGRRGPVRSVPPAPRPDIARRQPRPTSHSGDRDGRRRPRLVPARRRRHGLPARRSRCASAQCARPAGASSRMMTADPGVPERRVQAI